jgi:APA family basic amino acid/polyamine antiporter
LFYALVAASVFIFRRRLPDAERTYRVWGYPFTPIIFLGVSAWLIITTIYNTPRQSLIGLGLISLGLPVYLILDRRRST